MRALAAALTQPSTPAAATPPSANGQTAAAVLVPLYLPSAPLLGETAAGENLARAASSSLGELRVVLTRRRADLRRHAGEISFPGGRHDPEDPSLRATALREAEEEIGLPRAEVIELGTLPPTSTFVTNYLIHPLVGLIAPGRRWTISAREVDAVLEPSLAALLAAKTRTRLERRGISFETDAYLVGENVIWGATARILENLLARLHPLLG